MEKQKIIQMFKAKNGTRVAEIEQDAHGDYVVWKIERRDISPPGNRHSQIGPFHDLKEAEAEAKMIVVRYEQDQEEK